MRTWLRIEFLIQQMAFRPQIASHADARHFFRNAGDLLDVLERGEVRTDLVKELERQQRKLQSWAEVPGVDQERINEHAPPVEAVLQHPDGRAAHWSVSA